MSVETQNLASPELPIRVSSIAIGCEPQNFAALQSLVKKVPIHPKNSHAYALVAPNGAFPLDTSGLLWLGEFVDKLFSFFFAM